MWLIIPESSGWKFVKYGKKSGVSNVLCPEYNILCKRDKKCELHVSSGNSIKSVFDKTPK